MAATEPPTGGVYSATYSGIPVYEFQFGVDLKEHVMRRRHDDWINATHILKAAGFDKPARTRILEREVQKDVHEKIQGGYGKYQGTWIPLDHGEALAQRNNVYDRLRPIFEFTPGDVSPPPAPRHTSKPKAPRAPRPAVPKWTAPPQVIQEEMLLDDSSAMHDDDTPDNLTVASVSYAADDDHHLHNDLAQFSVPQRNKRKREDLIHDMTEQQHSVYGDELLDYFLLSRNEQPAIRPDPPTNFQPNWVIDTERHTALHWACAMGDVEVVKQLKRFGANLAVQNERGETPFMRAVSFTNCFEKQTFPAVLKELFETVDARDNGGCTIIHHAAIMKSGRVTSQSCARYYLDNILNRLQETHDPHFVQQLIDTQDNEGNTAVHLAAMKHASKCIRALLGRGASTDIPNHEGVRAEDLIKDLNANKKARGGVNGMGGGGGGGGSLGGPAGLPNPQRSSSPFAPDSSRRPGLRDVDAGAITSLSLQQKAGAAAAAAAASFQSEAATTVQSRITSLVLEKFQDLAAHYEDEFREKADAEKEARRILGNTQSELLAVRAGVAELEARIEPDDMAAKIAQDAGVSQKQLASLLTRRNRITLDAEAERELQRAEAATNGENGHSEDTSALVAELHRLVVEQRQAEMDYVDALAAVGTSDNIEKYRRLLRSCLGPEAESLEENLDGMIAMMEEEASDSLRTGNGAVEALEIAAL
ncbi:Transcription factor mbp1 (MBF subunit p120) [Sporothrix curviconia]|uniref:Transcription factor mbp1 (MBF subunit p120) n=1 Tax=Sporothrix curviconia TaxID=1260050 RepID=A0ABP0B032_9PEZI